MKLLEQISVYNKALVPGVVALALLALNQFGVTETMTVGDALSVLVTTFFVWLVPNRR